MSSVSATDEFASPRETFALLLRELARHNRHVVWLSLATAVAAAMLWAALYFIAQWLTLLFLTSARGVDTPLPRQFTLIFFVISGGVMAYAWIDRCVHPDDRPRDQRSKGEIALDFLYAVPRVTFAIFTTFSVRQKLTRQELLLAADLLGRLGYERRMRLQSVPLEIPDHRQRERILFVLQVMQFIDVQREDGDYWVKLNPLRPRASQELRTQ